jgi:hypothetical protein
MIKTPKNAEKFTCNICNFKCSKKSDFNRHIMTAKHKNRTNRTEKTPKNAEIFECECGKVYKARNSLWYHKKKCTYIYDDNDIIDDPPTINEPTNDATTILLLLKQNQEFKSLMVEQYTNLQINQANLQESNKKNQDLQQQLVDAVKNNTSNITNNTTNNNQRFNINFFLNDTCKDAMNITDFLRDIDVQNNELEYIGHNGYVSGMTKMITDRLKSMDVTKRPIHCTDIKRETMYIKDDGVWCKDTEELSKLRKILSRISMNNYRSVAKWRESHPESEILASRSYDFCYRMMQALLGDVEDEQIRLDNKIIKSMAQTLYVNKNINM